MDYSLLIRDLLIPILLAFIFFVARIQWKSREDTNKNTADIQRTREDIISVAESTEKNSNDIEKHKEIINELVANNRVQAQINKNLSVIIEEERKENRRAREKVMELIANGQVKQKND